MFDIIVACWFALALVVFAVLFFIPAPYGRHKEKEGRSIPDSWGWVVMELPAVLAFFGMFLVGTYHRTITAVMYLVMWMAHYIQRTFVYPFLGRKSEKEMPWRIVAMGFMFNLMNGYLNGRYVFEFSGGYPSEWLRDWRFLIGGGLFVVGYRVNREADRILRELREVSEREYEIPRVGMYRWISSPNYLGEILIWVGWAIATWSFVGWAFAAWTIANLAPRAWAHHRWYQDQFADYPPERKALIPGIW
jgi:protein-S-isoprenylcysteine O-methyltransferase Ste14